MLGTERVRSGGVGGGMGGGEGGGETQDTLRVTRNRVLMLRLLGPKAKPTAER